MRRLLVLLLTGSSLVLATHSAPAAASEPELDRLIVEISEVDEASLIDQVEELGGSVVAVLDAVPYVVVEDLPAYRAELLDGVESVQTDQYFRRTLDSALPVINAENADLDTLVGGAAVHGSGWNVVVIDDGIDNTHPFFEDANGDSRIIAEACFTEGHCAGGTADTSEGAGSAAHHAGDFHGTHVAGIAVGDGHGDVGAPQKGVAKESGLVAIQVFEPAGAGARMTDVNLALDWTISLIDNENLQVAAVNLSLGSVTTYTSSCDSLIDYRATKALVDELNERDVVVVVAAGNESKKTELSAPACLSNVLTVGATTDNDAIATYGNVSSKIADSGVVAPGSSITSSTPNSGFTAISGTSMATPMVSGAVAVLKSARPDATREQIVDALRFTGVPVDDQRSEGEVTGMPRIDVAAAVQYLVGGSLSGTISVSDGTSSDLVLGTEFTLDFEPDPSNEASAFSVDVTTDGAGEFLLENLPPGDWTVNASGFGFESMAAGSVTIAFEIDTPTALTVAARPAIASISPSRGYTTGGTQVTLSGIHFDGVTSVTFDGTEGTSLVVDAENGLLEVSTPSASAGVVDVVVTSPLGSSTDDITFTYEVRRRTSGGGGGGGGGGGAPTPRSVEVTRSDPGRVTANQRFTFGTVGVALAGSTVGNGAVTITPKAGKPYVAAGGIVLPGYWLDISTTVSGFETVEVCAPYEPARLPSYRINVDELRLFHWEGSVRHDITTRIDTTNNQVCGNATSLSPFAVGKLRTSRVAGDDRYRTAVEISRQQFAGSAPIVHLVTGEAFPDALAAGVAAGRAGGPVLLTRRNSLPDATAAELRRLSPSKVVIVGGPAAVSADVESVVSSVLSGVVVERIAGSNRYETAASLSAAINVTAGGVVFVGSGESFTEVLAGAAVAGRDRAPLLLVPGNGSAVPAAVATELQRLAPTRLVVLGSESVLSNPILAGLSALVPDATVERLGGGSSYDSAARTASFYATNGTVYVATGAVFADGLAGGAWAGRMGAPVVMVPPTGALPASVRSALSRLAPSQIVILGGSAAVSADIENELAQFLPA